MPISQAVALLSRQKPPVMMITLARRIHVYPAYVPIRVSMVVSLVGKIASVMIQTLARLMPVWAALRLHRGLWLCCLPVRERLHRVESDLLPTCIDGACGIEVVLGCTPCSADTECNDGEPCTNDVCSNGYCDVIAVPNCTLE